MTFTRKVPWIRIRTSAITLKQYFRSQASEPTLLVHGAFFSFWRWNAIIFLTLRIVAYRDTVSSIGIFQVTHLPETSSGMQHVCAFRHALALDERRVKFLPEYANGGDVTKGGNVKEVWFPGSHSDMYEHSHCLLRQKLKSPILSGGGNIPNEAGNIFGPALRWMTYEAAYFGLHLHTHKGDYGRIPLHLSMGWFWRIVELIPFLTPRTSSRTSIDHREELCG